MIRHLINGVQVVETIKPVIAGDEGMVSGRVFEPCHCVREMMMDKKIGADPALALRAEPASRLSASRSDQGERDFGDNGLLANAGFAAAPRFLNVNATELLSIYEAMKAAEVPHSFAYEQGSTMTLIAALDEGCTCFAREPEECGCGGYDGE